MRTGILAASALLATAANAQTCSDRPSARSSLLTPQLAPLAFSNLCKKSIGSSGTFASANDWRVKVTQGVAGAKLTPELCVDAAIKTLEKCVFGEKKAGGALQIGSTKIEILQNEVVKRDEGAGHEHGDEEEEEEKDQDDEDEEDEALEKRMHPRNFKRTTYGGRPTYGSKPPKTENEHKGYGNDEKESYGHDNNNEHKPYGNDDNKHKPYENNDNEHKPYGGGCTGKDCDEPKTKNPTGTPSHKPTPPGTPSHKPTSPVSKHTPPASKPATSHKATTSKGHSDKPSGYKPTPAPSSTVTRHSIKNPTPTPHISKSGTTSCTSSGTVRVTLPASSRLTVPVKPTTPVSKKSKTPIYKPTPSLPSKYNTKSTTCTEGEEKTTAISKTHGTSVKTTVTAPHTISSVKPSSSATSSKPGYSVPPPPPAPSSSTSSKPGYGVPVVSSSPTIPATTLATKPATTPAPQISSAVGYGSHY
ncbi:hypothetical protein CC80DRAFT_487018 [Byssothecium circinans]|uniref:Uncharacterized protein n=1 Tax=Byssothecium circinans TaxID=147558 RepID=A0A6A5UH68_9PLEO|nr:hypothetical protein CC80DRAFT_487018 [Byssothecium circinans]